MRGLRNCPVMLKNDKMASIASNKIAIIGMSVPALRMLKEFRKDLKLFDISLIDDDFDYENSELKLNFLQKFTRNANAECANENMSNFYGWSNQPKSLEWSSIVQNFKNGSLKHSEEISNLIKSHATQLDFSTVNFESEFGYLVFDKTIQQPPKASLKEKYSNQIDIYEALSDIVFEKSVVIVGDDPAMIEFALFLASFAQSQCTVLIGDALYNKFDEKMWSFVVEYFKKRNVLLVNERDESVKKDDIISKANFFIHYPSFDTDENFACLNSHLGTLTLARLLNGFRTRSFLAKSCNTNFEYKEMIATKIASAIKNPDLNKIPQNPKLSHYFVLRTPHEYSSLGYTEKQAQVIFGEENIEVQVFSGEILEHALTFGELEGSQVKLVSKKDDNMVLGMQIFSPHSRKILNGFMMMAEYDLKSNELTRNIGVHPTFAETIFTKLDFGSDFQSGAGCAT